MKLNAWFEIENLHADQIEKLLDGLRAATFTRSTQIGSTICMKKLIVSFAVFLPFFPDLKEAKDAILQAVRTAKGQAGISSPILIQYIPVFTETA